MTLTANIAHLPPLGSHQREEVGHQLHWTVVGPLFRPLHLRMGEMIDSWRELSDTVAERSVAIGFMPEGQSAAIASETPVHAVGPRRLEKQLWMIRAQRSGGGEP